MGGGQWLIIGMGGCSFSQDDLPGSTKVLAGLSGSFVRTSLKTNHSFACPQLLLREFTLLSHTWLNQQMITESVIHCGVCQSKTTVRFPAPAKVSHKDDLT
ncbi:hypothetical protein HUJ04_010263 [Dendroctonus ponderosae]|nr:hypothetical protein HUJ04_010263 [Dendroctonus ponderosae]